MQRILSTCASAAVALLLATGALAQMNTPSQRPGTNPGTTTTGVPFDTVMSVDRVGNTVVVRNAAGELRTIRMNDATSIERRNAVGGRPLGIGDLAAGDRVIVSDPATRGGFTPRVELLGPSDVGAGPPGARPPAANPAAPPTGVTTPNVNAPGVSNPAAPPPGTVRPNAQNPGAPPTGGPAGGAGSGAGGAGGGGSGGGGGGGM